LNVPKSRDTTLLPGVLPSWCNATPPCLPQSWDGVLVYLQRLPRTSFETGSSWSTPPSNCSMVLCCLAIWTRMHAPENHTRPWAKAGFHTRARRAPTRARRQYRHRHVEVGNNLISCLCPMLFHVLGGGFHSGHRRLSKTEPRLKMVIFAGTLQVQYNRISTKFGPR
jgi:hypothetical protein